MAMNIDAEAICALEGRSLWSSEIALATAQAVAEVSGLAVSWDVYSGEDWITLLQGDAAVCHLYVLAPFAFVESGPVSRLPSTVAAVDVNSLSGTVLCVSSELGSELFGELVGSDLEWSGFTPEDLWFATI